MLLTSGQKQSLSTFFNNIAVAWFVAIFITPTLISNVKLLTIIAYAVNMIVALYLSLFLLKE